MMRTRLHRNAIRRARSARSAAGDLRRAAALTMLVASAESLAQAQDAVEPECSAAAGALALRFAGERWTPAVRAAFEAELRTELEVGSVTTCRGSASRSLRLEVATVDGAETLSLMLRVPECPAPLRQVIARGDMDTTAWAFETAVSAAELVRAGSIEARCEDAVRAQAALERAALEQAQLEQAQLERAQLQQARRTSPAAPDPVAPSRSTWMMHVAATALAHLELPTAAFGGAVSWGTTFGGSFGLELGAGAEQSLPVSSPQGSGEMTGFWAGLYGLLAFEDDLLGLDVRLGCEAGAGWGRGVAASEAHVLHAVLPFVLIDLLVRARVHVTGPLWIGVGLGARQAVVGVAFEDPTGPLLGFTGFGLRGTLSAGIAL